MKHTRTHTHHHPTHPRPLAQAQTPTHSTQTPRSIHNVLFQTTLLHRINVPNTGNNSTGASSTATAKVEQTEQPPQRRNNWRSTVTTSSASYPLPQAKWVRTPPPLLYSPPHRGGQVFDSLPVPPNKSRGQDNFHNIKPKRGSKPEHWNKHGRCVYEVWGGTSKQMRCHLGKTACLYTGDWWRQHYQEEWGWGGGGGGGIQLSIKIHTNSVSSKLRWATRPRHMTPLDWHREIWARTTLKKPGCHEGHIKVKYYASNHEGHIKVIYYASNHKCESALHFVLI